jgi:hypothetical protein
MITRFSETQDRRKIVLTHFRVFSGYAAKRKECVDPEYDGKQANQAKCDCKFASDSNIPNYGHQVSSPFADPPGLPGNAKFGHSRDFARRQHIHVIGEIKGKLEAEGLM